MLKQLLLKLSLHMSEKDIVGFLDKFSRPDTEQNAPVVGMAVLLRCQISEIDANFEQLLNSRKGENLAEISRYVLTLNRLVRECRSDGRLEQGAATKLWNITFRCMSDPSLNHYGVRLWGAATRSYLSGKRWLEMRLDYAKDGGYENDIRCIQIALDCDHFVPLQFDR